MFKLACILLGAVTTERSSAFLLTPLGVLGSTSMGSDILVGLRNLVKLFDDFKKRGARIAHGLAITERT